MQSPRPRSILGRRFDVEAIPPQFNRLGVMSVLDSARQGPLIQVPDSFEWIEVIQILVCDHHEVASRTINPKPHPAMMWWRKLHDGLSRKGCGQVG